MMKRMGGLGTKSLGKKKKMKGKGRPTMPQLPPGFPGLN